MQDMLHKMYSQSVYIFSEFLLLGFRWLLMSGVAFSFRMHLGCQLKEKFDPPVCFP